MNIDPVTYRDAIEDLYLRCSDHQIVGIPLSAILEGTLVPDGWHLDVWTQYFVPPDYIANPSGTRH